MDYAFFAQTQTVVALAALVIFGASVLIRSGGVKER